MRIRLTKNLPIDPLEGAVKGEEYEVIEVKGSKRRPLYIFEGCLGECGAWYEECEVINE